MGPFKHNSGFLDMKDSKTKKLASKAKGFGPNIKSMIRSAIQDSRWYDQQTSNRLAHAFR